MPLHNVVLHGFLWTLIELPVCQGLTRRCRWMGWTSARGRRRWWTSDTQVLHIMGVSICTKKARLAIDHDTLHSRFGIPEHCHPPWSVLPVRPPVSGMLHVPVRAMYPAVLPTRTGQEGGQGVETAKVWSSGVPSHSVCSYRGTTG